MGDAAIDELPALMIPGDLPPGSDIVVLAGGGIETTALMPRLVALGYRVQPLHVRCGFRWEAEESASLSRFLERHAGPALKPLLEIDSPLRGLLGTHWGMSGESIPASGDEPARLEIPLRNITLLTSAAIWFRGVPDLVLATGTTADNHFGDGSRAFFDQCERVLGMATRRGVRVLTPFIRHTKIQVIQGSDIATLADSWSCIDPQAGRHCGRCIKCGRRQAAFGLAGLTDPTAYAPRAGVTP